MCGELGGFEWGFGIGGGEVGCGLDFQGEVNNG